MAEDHTTLLGATPEDEPYCRRLGVAVVHLWNELSPELQCKLIHEATTAFDQSPQSSLGEDLRQFIAKHTVKSV